MNNTVLLVAGGGLGVVLLGIALWIGLRDKKKHSGGKKDEKANLTKESLEKMAREDVDRIFNDEFREELRNMGRLHFQKVVSENAMFLKEDLRLTSSQLNEYLKAEVTKHLQDSFAGYDQSLGDAKELAIQAVEKITTSLEEQRLALTSKLEEDVEIRKAQIIEEFQTRLADIVNHYLLAAVGEQVDLSAQLEYILGELQKNKNAIVEDLAR